MEPVTVPPEGHRSTSAWWQVLLGGLVAYIVGIALLVLTQNPVLFPTVVMIGSYTVPAAYVAFFYQRRALSSVNMPLTSKAFLYGGLLGVFAASLLEPIFIGGQSVPNALMVGLIEEFAKILGILLIARHREHDAELDGIVLGAAAGMGFAALESVGYAFSVFIRSSGSLSSALGVTLLRGLLSPVGHGTWTAILVGVLFRESHPGRFRLNGRVLRAYLTVVLLHGLWDALPIVIASIAPQGIDVLLGQLIVGAVGIVILALRWREARRLQLARGATATPSTLEPAPASRSDA